MYQLITSKTLQGGHHCQLLPTEAASSSRTITRAFVSSRLDYCNAILLEKLMRRHNQCTSCTNTTACRFQDCRLGIPVSIITELFQMRTHQEKYFFSETSRILLATSRKCTMGQLYFLLVVDQIPEMTCYHDHARRVGAPCC